MKKTTGFTLIELMVTLAVIAVLIAIGAPRLGNMADSNRLTATINSLSADLAFARSEAINRNTPVSITAVGGVWGNGWTVQEVATATPLRNTPAIPQGLTLVEAGNNLGLTYGSDGILANNIVLNFTLCEAAGTPSRIINISAAGRTTTARGVCP